MKMKNNHCYGFTLKELIVVLVLLGVLILIGTPIYTYARNNRFEKAMLRGIGIYKALFAGLVDMPPEQFRRYEVVGEFPQTPNSPHDPFTTVSNSNEYFVDLVKNDILSVDWSFFSGPGVQRLSGKYDSTAPESVQAFTQDGNFWCVVADLNLKMIESGDPFLISHNIQADPLRTQYSPTDPVMFKSLRRGVVISMGGSGTVYKRNQTYWRDLNPNHIDNPVLQPGPPVPLK